MSLSVPAGSFVAVMGATGSGKSTLLLSELSVRANVLLPARLGARVVEDVGACWTPSDWPGSGTQPGGAVGRAAAARRPGPRARTRPEVIFADEAAAAAWSDRVVMLRAGRLAVDIPAPTPPTSARGPGDEQRRVRREVLGLLAEGLSNPAIAARLHLGERSVEKDVTAIFPKLDLPPTRSDSRRVLAVLRYLQVHRR